MNLMEWWMEWVKMRVRGNKYEGEHISSKQSLFMFTFAFFTEIVFRTVDSYIKWRVILVLLPFIDDGIFPKDLQVLHIYSLFHDFYLCSPINFISVN